MQRPAVRVFLVLLGVAAVTAAAAPAAGAAQIAPPSSIAKAHKITFCSDISYPPEEFFKTGTQTPIGSDVQIATALARLMGVKAEFLNTGFDGIIPALQGSKCDAIISGMTITAKRAKQVSFVPYLNVGESFMAKKGSKLRIRSLADLSGKAVAAEVATTEATQLQAEDKALKKKGKPGITVRIYPKDTDAAAALATGKVDLYFSDTPPVAYHIAQNKGRFQIAGPQLYASPLGIAVRKNEGQLRTALTKGVKAIYRDGTMRKILAQWQMSFAALKSAA